MRHINRLIAASLSCFLLIGCNNNTEEPRQPGDGYVDTLPEKTSDGTMLHAFCWTFKQIKDNLPSIKEAGYKAVQTMPVSEPKANGVEWWSFYQPIAFEIATGSPLGGKEELRDLCSEAEKYGIDIIVDVVFNHMATTGKKDADGLPEVDPVIAQYEPEIYNNLATTFHHYKGNELSGSGSVTQIYLYGGGLPDLNTSNPLVQSRALHFLKECIDCGVDGFRFDAAKHIETPDDPDHASDFWTNTLGVAKEYYKEQNNNKELYAYGEVLNEIGGGRDPSVYTKMMKITDNFYGDGLKTALLSSIATGQTLVDANYGKTSAPEYNVTWCESHDTFVEESGHFNSNTLVREWAIVASRAKSNPLFLAHTDDNFTVGQVYNYDFEDNRMSAINNFHNRFVGAEEYRFAIDNYYICERYSATDNGAVVVSRTGKKTPVKVTFKNLEDGYYFDQVSGTQYHLVNKTAEIKFSDGSGVVVLTKTANNPRAVLDITSRGEQYYLPLQVTITIKNGVTMSYTIDDNAPVSFTDTVTVTIGNSGYEDGRITTLKVNYSNGQQDYERSFYFEKISLIDGGFNIFNLKEEYLTEYSLYTWSWGTGNDGTWAKNYEWVADKKVLLVKNTENLDGFLLGLFPKDYVVSDIHSWDSNVLKQTNNIIPSTGFYDAGGF